MCRYTRTHEKSGLHLCQEKERAAQELKARSRHFILGKYAYERGQYQKAVEALEEALDREGPFTQLGGDIQLWLALAYNVRQICKPFVHRPGTVNITNPFHKAVNTLH